MLNNLPQDNLGLSVLLSLDQGTSFGSGFRLKYADSNFLVTSRHVLYDESFKLRSNHLIVTCQSSRGYDLEPLIFEVELDKAKVFYSKTDDVAIFLIGTNKKLYDRNIPLKTDPNKHKRQSELQLEEYINVTSPGNQLIISVDSEATRKLDSILIANEIYLLGYPISLALQQEKFFDYSKPLLRKGIIAGVNKKENTFIIDCPSYFGNSGGPVIEHGEDDYYRTVGLVSRYIPFVVEWKNTREYISNKEYTNSGYTICVPMDAVFSLIDTNFKQDITTANS